MKWKKENNLAKLTGPDKPAKGGQEGGTDRGADKECGGSSGEPVKTEDCSSGDEC